VLNLKSFQSHEVVSSDFRAINTLDWDAEIFEPEIYSGEIRALLVRNMQERREKCGEGTQIYGSNILNLLFNLITEWR
jgi:hypothetical protein